ncbi:hypothetical protein ACH47Z_25690 [Streptomyces sp. NPDC020192]|uniref:hypothetical protein n=1 Tax=Streptomyces sp. NPDC020192 TaxID=3365066 RepID=UPI0037A02D87
MRLNQVADPGGGGSFGGQQGLTSSPAEKQAAANAIENDIEPGTRTAGAWADHETGAVVKAFGAKDGHGWLTSGAVRTAHKIWGEQVQDLMNLLSADKGALRGANTTLISTDGEVAAGVRRPSVLDQYSQPPQN